MTTTGPHVIKLGGSLLDLPDLVQRFEAFARAHVHSSALLVVGGGRAADVVRAFDRQYGLDESQGHWLAIGAMQFNAQLVAAVLPDARMVAGPAECQAVWNRDPQPRRGRGRGTCLAVMDPVAWLRRREAQGVTIPHQWTFTSDSIAAHVATQLGAARLTLLKSSLPAGACSVAAAAASGLVDAHFERASASLAHIDVVNLRWPDMPCCTLR